MPALVTTAHAIRNPHGAEVLPHPKSDGSTFRPPSAGNSVDDMIEVNGLTKLYGRLCAVDDLGFRAEAGPAVWQAGRLARRRVCAAQASARDAEAYAVLCWAPESPI